MQIYILKIIQEIISYEQAESWKKAETETYKWLNYFWERKAERYAFPCCISPNVFENLFYLRRSEVLKGESCAMGFPKSIFKSAMFVLNAGKDTELKIKCISSALRFLLLCGICHLNIQSCTKKGGNIDPGIDFGWKSDRNNMPKVVVLMKVKERPTVGF